MYQCIVQVMDSQCFSREAEPSFISNVWCHDFKFSNDLRSVSFTLSWQPVSSASDPIHHCNIYLSSIIVADGNGGVANADNVDALLVTSSPWKSEHKFLGRSYAKSCYRVTKLYLLNSLSNDPEEQEGTGNSSSNVLFEFRVQPVLASHCKPAVQDCPAILVDFKR